jgi:RNA polymerase sigma-70 factor (ECF subfamily)
LQDTESLWLIKAQKGDGEAFTKLVEAYQKPVFNMCYRMLNNAEDAEDAAQETFLRAYKALRRYDNKRAFATWLLSIAAHYCIDQIRKRRITMVSIEDMPYMELSDGEPGPEKSMGNKEDKEKIRSLLTSLNPTDRAAVVMYYWYDFSYDEIAEVLNLTMSAVKSRLHRSRREMAQSCIQKQALTLQVERKQHESPAF